MAAHAGSDNLVACLRDPSAFFADRDSATVLIRLMVGVVFLSEGVQKFLFPESLDAGRFEKIGIAVPDMSAPFVAVVEIACGALVLVGLASRLAASP